MKDKIDGNQQKPKREKIDRNNQQLIKGNTGKNGSTPKREK